MKIESQLSNQLAKMNEEEAEIPIKKERQLVLSLTSIYLKSDFSGGMVT